MNKKLIIPAVILGLVVVGVIVSLLFSGPRMEHHPSLEAYEAELNQPPEDAVPYGKETFDPAEVSLPEANSKNMSSGKVYYDYYCVFCHGENGKGHGPVGQSYVPEPANLNVDSIRNYNKIELYQAIFKGTGHEPVLERVVKPEHRRYIMMYIRNGFE